MFKILIVDDDPTLRLLLKRTLQNQGYDVILASNGEEGIAQAQLHPPALIICDWMMSEMDGLEVCRRIKADPELSTAFFILLTAKGKGIEKEAVEERVKGLDAGADEFLSKPVEMEEVKARVRAGLRLYELNQKLQTLNQDLQTQKQAMEKANHKLQAELDEAAAYVLSLLPSPLKGTVSSEAVFIPSARLGGDCFDFYWLYDGILGIYLLDVSGHGVGAALLSVAVLNFLRSQPISEVNFLQPSQVLKALNDNFQMDNHNDKYFTIWYGVYDQYSRQLVYASAGHPPAVILSGTPENIQVKRLVSSGLPIGFLPDSEFDNCYLNIEENSSLYIFSDGAYEIHQPDGKIWGIDAFISLLTNCRQKNTSNLNEILQHIRNLNHGQSFEDDLSLLKINFN
ncbi:MULTISPECIES: PP2C family protein-serine/threonine phosphatase [Aerosakkonema]|uniref:PP2C family protein-serine/threonine phosphatase n=1 Tax=Aerosakkonema TaxID=1246629 RepID=UPI0035B91C13